MARVSNYTRTRIELPRKQGLHPAEIFKLLKGEGLLASFASVTRIIKKLKLTGSVADVACSGRPLKLSEEARGFIDDQMKKDDEMTSGRIKKILGRRGVTVSSATVRRARKQLDWTLQRTAYCQLIQNVNKEKRLAFTQSVIENGDTFENVIFSDVRIHIKVLVQTLYCVINTDFALVFLRAKEMRLIQNSAFCG